MWHTHKEVSTFLTIQVNPMLLIYRSLCFIREHRTLRYTWLFSTPGTAPGSCTGLNPKGTPLGAGGTLVKLQHPLYLLI